MPVSELNWFVVLPIIFWGTIVASALIYLIKDRDPPSSLDRRSSVATVASAKEKVLHGQEVIVRTLESPPVLFLSKEYRGRPMLPPPAYVDFDPRKAEHCLALRMLMQNPARLHPTLRFHFDPAVHDNAYFFMLHELANQYIDRFLNTKKLGRPDDIDPTTVDPILPLAQRI